MKILMTVNSFANLTGSEVSTYELARELVKRNHDVVVMSRHLGGVMADKASTAGIELHHPDNRLRTHFDVLHLCHHDIGQEALRLFPHVPAVNHVRSEVIPVFEVPIRNLGVKKYISIRPSVTSYIKSYGITDENITEIQNGFDTQRFNTDYEFTGNTKERLLFVGTMDYLRKAMLFNAARLCRNTGRTLWIVGTEGDYLEDLRKICIVEHFGIREDVENFYKIVDGTVGIFRGRTTIEGWLCDVPAMIYTVDKIGAITGRKYVEPPQDLSAYDIKYSTDRVLETYKEVIRES